MFKKRPFLIIGLTFIFLAVIFYLYSYLCNTGILDAKAGLTENYRSVYSHFKELTASGKLRRGSLKFSFFKDLFFIRYLPFQVIAFLRNLASINFWASVLCILSLYSLYSIFGIPIYSRRIPLIFMPLLGFINLAIIFVFISFITGRYSCSIYLLTAIIISSLIFVLRLIIYRGSARIEIRQEFRSRENFIIPAILILIGLFVISGHLAHLNIPRSYDHMSYTTLSSLLKIERTYPRFDIYGFPSTVNCNIPPGWVVTASFVSDLLNISVARTQLMLVITFFPFLGIGVYYICRLIFKDYRWALCAGLLALSMRMSSISPTDGDMPEVLEWALVAFGLFALFSYLEGRDIRFLILSTLSFFVSFIIHAKLTLYCFGAFLFSIPFSLFRHGLKETARAVFFYLLIIGSVYLLALPHILSMTTNYGIIGKGIRLALIEFFENMVFRHGYPMVLLVTLGIPFFIRSRNRVIIFCFSYFLMFLIYFDQWLLWELIKPSWYAKELSGTVNFFGGVGTYTSFIRFGSSYSQIFSGFNVVLPILFMYAAYRIIPRRYLKAAAAGVAFTMFLIYESGIRPEVPVQLIGDADFHAARWIRENTERDNTFVANIGNTNYYLWNISGITERKCLYYRALKLDPIGLKVNPFAGLDFQDMLKRNPEQTVALLKRYKFTHLMISEDSRLAGEELAEKASLRKVYQHESNGKVSRVYSII